MAKGWFDFILPPPPIYLSRGRLFFCKLPQIINRCFEYAAQTKPPAGSILGSEAGGGRHDLAGSKPEQGQQAEEEAAPAHDPNPKNSKAPERYAPGPAVIFYGKKSCFSGALRRLALSLCGDYDDAHRYQIAFLIGYLAKRSAHVAVVCGLLAAQAQKVVCTTLVS